MFPTGAADVVMI